MNEVRRIANVKAVLLRNESRPPTLYGDTAAVVDAVSSGIVKHVATDTEGCRRRHAVGCLLIGAKLARSRRGVSHSASAAAQIWLVIYRCRLYDVGTACAR